MQGKPDEGFPCIHSFPCDIQECAWAEKPVGNHKKDFKRNLEVLFLLPVNRCATTVSVHKEVFSYERLVATSVMEAAAFSLSMVDHGLDDSAIASISFMVARSTSPTPVK